MFNKNRNIKGFTLMEMLIVVAIIAVLVAISIPVFTNHIEKSREATDLANVRGAYAEMMASVLTSDEKPARITVNLSQKIDNWQMSLPITIGGVTYDGIDTVNWKGTPKKSGVCVLSYDESNGIIFTWKQSLGDINTTKTNTLNKAYSMVDDQNMNGRGAYFSNQNITIDGKALTVRVYYAGSDAFKSALKNYTPTPTTYDKSPFYEIENDHNTNMSDGFAYYTYGENGSIKEFTYVGSDKVYRTTDEGKTWQDITP